MGNLSATADDILACARNLVIAGGYNGFSYADIADVVGIRKPSIHHHFPTKADLVRTLVSRHREDTQTALAHIERQVPDPLEQLRAYSGYWKACIKDDSVPFCVCALLACELPVLPAEVALEVRAYFRAFSEWLTSVLERGQQDGRLALTHSPRIEAETFMATVHGAMLSARAYGDPEIFGAITDPLVDRLSIRQ
ncbi:TetR/AcrR family transcriptional regulator [Chelatococcus sp. GCM10030263]|uniref:TetR/AcrR family transcriptional regulator n=1 Tax=Chelatococcus sp. GCM10030263 TaxID=3273387 RepID=UPI00360F9B73